MNLSERSAAAQAQWDLSQSSLEFNRHLATEAMETAKKFAQKIDTENGRILAHNARFAALALEEHGIEALTDSSLSRLIYHTLYLTRVPAIRREYPGSNGVLNEVNKTLAQHVPFFESAYLDPIIGQEMFDDALTITLKVPEGLNESDLRKLAEILDPLMKTQTEVFPYLHEGNQLDVPCVVLVGQSPAQRSTVWLVKDTYEIPVMGNRSEFPDLHSALVEAYSRVRPARSLRDLFSVTPVL